MSGLDGLGWPTDTMIDWSTAPEWAIGAAMDEDGEWYWYESKPLTAGIAWDGEGRCSPFISNPEPVDDWEESWTTRPVTEPMTTEPITTEPINDGGSAFPTHDYQEGMSLRDYFAGQAIAYALANPNFELISFEESATGAYMMADAMLEARTLKPE